MSKQDTQANKDTTSHNHGGHDRTNIPLSEIVFADATSVENFARLVGISRCQSYIEIKEGRLESFKVGKRRLISRLGRESWCAKMQELSDEVDARLPLGN